MEAQSQPTSSLNPLVDEVENISQQIRKDLECPVCMELASKIHCCCVNGHIVCESCLLRLWQFSDFPACPMCRSVLSTAAFKSAFVLAITNLMNSFKITCSNRAHGCLELVSIANMNEHESSCTYVPDVKCFVSTCQWSGIYAQIFNHVKSVHPTSAVSVQKKSWTICNIYGIINRIQRKVYLIRDERDGSMFWIIFHRGTRKNVRMVVMMIKNSAKHFSTRPHMVYQVKLYNSETTPYGFFGKNRLIVWDKDVAGNRSQVFPVNSTFSIRHPFSSRSLIITWNRK